YTRMVLTTTSNRTYNDLRTKRMQEFGQVLCLMSSHPNSREACAYIQGKVVNIVPTDDPNYNDKYDSIYNHGYGEPAGTLGINCRHKLFPFTPGVNVNNMTQYDPKEAIRNGDLRQKQRYYERSIRDAKKRLKIAEELEDEQMITRTKTLISARQKKLREYIKETNKMYGKKYDILTRDYAREQIFSKSILKESGAIRERTQSFVDFKPLLPEEKTARNLYIQFAQRSSKSSINKISKAGNVSVEDASEIYNHIFVDKHLTLDKDGNKVMAKFVPNIDMAQSFQRIFNGQKLHEEDIILLKHELYERKLMKNNPNMTYKEAHNLTNKIYDYESLINKLKAGDDSGNNEID
uniref:phage minor capsid protein n=1 Tax=Ligilactobacillus salivarius TaxID=1624 RepID=UPI0024BA6E1A